MKDVLVDGKPQDFAAWLGAERIDIRLPLVADNSGAMINVSFQGVDATAGTVAFYAPVFPEWSGGVE